MKLLGKKIKKSKIKPEGLFLLKLFNILKDKKFSEYIYWSTDGKSIIIPNKNKFIKNVLPKFCNTQKYSSFVRQLNMYGFHKSKGIMKKGESYELDKFIRESTKDEINQIVRPNKKVKNLVEYIKTNQKTDNNDFDFLSKGSEDDILKYLFEKNEENSKNSIVLRKEMDELKKENDLLTGEIKVLKSLLNTHANLIEKILKKNTNNKVQKCTKNVKNLNDLFSKYLYFLRIYSPFVNIDNLIKQKYEKEETLSVDNINTNDKKESDFNTSNNNDINNIKSDINSESVFEELSIFNTRNDFPVLDLNLPYNSSNSFFNNMYFN